MSPLTLTPQPSFQRQIGLGRESVWGAAVADTLYYQADKAKFEDVPKWSRETGYRGKRSKTITVQQGAISSTFDTGEMKFYPDDSGMLLFAVLGTDNITGAGPYTHTLTQLDALPSSFTWTDYTALGASGNARQYTGGYFEEVDLKYTVDGDLVIQGKGQGKPSTLVSKPTAAYSAAAFYEGYQAQLTLAAQVNARIAGMTFAIKQKLTPIFGGNNQQGPTAMNVAGLEVTGTMDVVPNDETEWLYMINNTQPAASLLFTSGTNTLTLQMTKCAFTKAPLDTSKDYVGIPMTFEAAYNATDAGTFKAILVNGRSTAYSVP